MARISPEPVFNEIIKYLQSIGGQFQFVLNADGTCSISSMEFEDTNELLYYIRTRMAKKE